MRYALRAPLARQAIQENLVLTAAHCVDFVENPRKTKVYVAKGNIKYDSENFQFESADDVTEAVEIFVHPDYRKSDGNDIAIIRVKTSQPLSGPFVTLAKPRSKLRNMILMTAVGFGVSNDYLQELINPTEEGAFIATSPSVLYETDLQLRRPGQAPCPRKNKRPDACDESDGGDKYNCLLITDEKEFCVVGGWFYGKNPNTPFGVGKKSACSGDSGGPIYYKGVQYGVAGRVLDRALCQQVFLNPYTVYTRVSAHRKDFIDPIVRKNPYKCRGEGC